MFVDGPCRFLNMVAEIGGYLGLTLGVSLHDINTIILALRHKAVLL